MSLQWQLSRSIPEDTAALGEKVLPAEDVYRQIGERFDELFPHEGVFAALYAQTGRGAVPPLLMSLVIVFQMLEKAPDRLAARWTATRLDWKYALHLPLEYAGFHFTDLGDFRQRLLEHQQERLVFDQLLQQLQALGVLKGQGKQRTDATHVLGVVQRLSQLELLSESLRVALRAVEQVAAAWVQTRVPVAFQQAYQERRSDFGLSEAEVRQGLIQIGQDGFWFLAQVEQSSMPELGALREVQTLRAVLQQQFPQGPYQPPAAKRPQGREIIESPHEPEVRYATKRGQGWTGYKLQVTETCDVDQPHLIVDLEPTGALANDSPALPAIQQRLQAQQLLPSEQQVDQGYMSGANLVQSAALGVTLMGKPLADTQAPAGFRQGDFQIDLLQQQATCPAGQTSRIWSPRPATPGAPAGIQIRFDGATCGACAFFGQCTSSPKGRSLSLHPYREALEARRGEAQSAAFLKRLHLRAGIEGTISELVRAHGLRRARYRGQPKLGLQGYFTAVAVNLKRLTRWWAKTGQPEAMAA